MQSDRYLQRVISEIQIIMKNNFLHQTIKKPKKGWNKDHFIYQCSDGLHNSFWATVIQSEAWDKWYKENMRKMWFDVDECMGCGWISPEHFQEFLKFTIKNANKIPFEGKIK